MTSNPKTSKWYSTPNTRRNRKRFEVTVADETLAALDELESVYGSRSAAVDEAIKLLAAKHRKGK